MFHFPMMNSDMDSEVQYVNVSFKNCYDIAILILQHLILTFQF